jgi:plasmid replication initiation protein
MAKAQKKNNKGIVLIKKSNNLVESKYKFDIWETRFFLSVLSQIRREDTDFQVYRIWYKDIIKIFGLKSGDSYAFLREAARVLMNKSVQINYEENGIKRTKELHLINKIDYLTEGQKSLKNIGNHEYIDVTVEQEMRPFLLQLSKNFTAYDLRNVTKLSVYSIRLYELLKQYETIGVRAMSIEEMKSMFQVEEQYKLYSDFYRWIIKPSEIEINKHTDLLITNIEKLKEGRKIVALRFRFRAKTEQELSNIRGNPFQNPLFNSLPEPEKIDVRQEIEEQVQMDAEKNKGIKEKKTPQNKDIDEEVLADIENTAQEKLIVELLPIVVTQFGVSFKMFTRLVEKHTEGEIRQAVQVTEKAIQTGRIDNKAGFFVGAVRNHYQDAELQKKQTEANKLAEKKAKAEAMKRVEEAAKKQKEEAVRYESHRKMNVIKNLIQNNSDLIPQAIEELSRGMFSKGYDPTKTIEENLENAMFAGAMMNVLQKIEPLIFHLDA